ncbi:MAG: hypothetical protein CUN55_11220 [Phototrophicales bacterium]|nr:MAG: hypothetical protein CUN55_11220 [Phototrophicales bacterium]
MLNNPHRLAWLTLLTSFALFIVVCVGLFSFGRYVLFEWPINMETTLYVSRGTAGVLRSNDLGERSVRDLSQIDNGDRLSTDELAQSVIVFADPFNPEIVVATVQLRANSEVKLNSAHRPRFFGDAPYRIHLSNLQGTLEIFVAGDLDRDVMLEVNAAGGDIRISTSGLYNITAQLNQLLISTERGQALVITKNGGQLVNAGQEARISPQEHVVNPMATVNLVQNSELAPPPSGAVMPLGWGCGAEAEPGNDSPVTLGTYGPEHFQGRDTFHIRRISDVQLFPARSFCKQFFTGTPGQQGLDVSEYDSLRIRVRMYLVQHTLPGCGQLATECVLMVHLRYRNAADPSLVRDYYQGFYASPADGLGWPRKCDSCANDHLHVNAGVWYTFESTDLVQDLPADLRDLRPIILEFIEFYASGHGYEVYVDEVSLLAQKLDGETTTIQMLD